MEVHHHPSVEKKGFKEYFLEFLMIFLAVTLGFFAETMRENINEHSRAKEFARSMVKDLEADTAQLRTYRVYFNMSANNVDTFMQRLALDEPKNIPSGKLYWYGLFECAHRHFVSNDATFEQMKSSGSLRYFEKILAPMRQNTTGFVACLRIPKKTTLVFTPKQEKAEPYFLFLNILKRLIPFFKKEVSGKL
jgi:hypothetical protein